MLLTFQVPNLLSLFHSSGRAKVSVRAQGKCSYFVTKPIFKVRSCQHPAQPPQSGGPPLVGCPRLHIQYNRISEAVPPPATPGRAMPW